MKKVAIVQSNYIPWKGYFDMIAAVEAPSVHEMDALIDEIGALNGVERTNSSIVLSTKFDR